MFMDPVPPEVVYALGVIVLLIGSAWIIRIARGPGKDSDHWRYRKK